MDHPRRVRLPAEVCPWTKGSARFDPEPMWAGTPACSPAPMTPCSRATARRSTHEASSRGPGSACAPRVSIPDRREPPGPLDASQVEQRRARSPLHQVLPELRAALTAVAEDARHVMVVTDADGVLLWREGSTRVRHRADALGFTEGARWTEGAVGTNAIGTALAEGVAGADLLRRALRPHPSRLDLHRLPGARPAQRRDAGRRRRQRARRDGAPDDRRARRHGREAGRGEPVAPPRAAARRAAHRRRAGAGVRVRSGPRRRRPRVGRGRPRSAAAWTGWPHRPRTALWPCTGWDCACPSRSRVAGCCVRGARAGRCGSPSSSTRTRPAPSSPARTCGCIPCRPGTPRCSCCWPARGRPGWTPPRSARRSTATSGSLVTIRAEVSRLRKAIGGILLARPYRLAPEVEVVLPDLATSPFAAASTAPAVRALARA